MSTLPGLGGRPYQPIEGERFQEIANRTGAAIYAAVHQFHALEAPVDRTGAGDAGPIIAGALAGVIKFAAQSPLSDSELRARYLKIFDDVIGQLRMQQSANVAEGGRA